MTILDWIVVIVSVCGWFAMGWILADFISDIRKGNE